MTAEALAVVGTLAVAFWACAFGGGGAYIASVRRRPIAGGVAFGLVLGPIGLLIEALLPLGPEDVDLVDLRVNGVGFGRWPRADAELVQRMAREGRFRRMEDVERFVANLRCPGRVECDVPPRAGR